MSITTKTGLQTAIQDYLLQDDISARLDDLIKLAEVRFDREIRHRLMVAMDGPTNIPSDGLVTLPDDFVELVALSIDSSQPYAPEYVPPAQYVALPTQRSPGKPRFYTVIGSGLHITPAPDGVYQLAYYYYQKIPSLLTENSNWLLTEGPDIYLYGTLLEAEPYLVNDARVATWQQLYERARDSLLKADRRARWRPGGQVQRQYKHGLRESSRSYR